MAAIIQLLLDRYVLRAEALEPARPVSRDAISQLRFEAQEIVQEIRLQVRDKEAPTSARTDRIEETIETIAQQLDQALAQFGKTANSLEPAVEPSR
jgi:methyl-accepting chemotaxis protein